MLKVNHERLQMTGAFRGLPCDASFMGEEWGGECFRMYGIQQKCRSFMYVSLVVLFLRL